jgi:H+/Cl- antiporter ClcA
MMTARKRTAEEREEARIGLLTMIAGIIGFVSGLIAFVLFHLIGFLTNLLYYGKLSISFASPQYNQLGLAVVLVPAFGGLVAGLMIKYGSNRIVGHGIPEAIESVLLSKSRKLLMTLSLKEDGYVSIWEDAPEFEMIKA